MSEKNTMENGEPICLSAERSGVRLDAYLAEQLPELSRARLQKLIKDGQVLVEGEKTKASRALSAGEEIELVLPAAEVPTVEPENIPLDIVYEDADIVVVNKAAGMVVHPAVGNWSGTLVNALLYHCRDLSGINGVLRPGIVHRIDKDTTGLIVAAKNDAAHAGLAAQLLDHSMYRLYLALVHGCVTEPGGSIEAPIGRHPRQRQKMAVEPEHGKWALTHYQVKKRFARYSLLEYRLETGRTHQIRVHSAYLGYPIVGDTLYGRRKEEFAVPGQLLHAHKLILQHPKRGERMEFSAPLPARFAEILDSLEQGGN